MTDISYGPDLADTIDRYLHSVHEARSENTARAYRNAMNTFLHVLSKNGLESTSPVSKISEECISYFLSYLKVYSAATEHLYTQAVKGFYQYLAGEKIVDVNLPRIDLLINKRSRRASQRLPQFPREDIEKVLDYVGKLKNASFKKQEERLRAIRDRAFVLTLADTGLRIHEACGLLRGDIDWNEGRAIIIGKGNKQAIVRFSSRSIDALVEYLRERSLLDGGSGRPLTSLPLFARHDKGSGKKVKKITTTTGRNIVASRVREALGCQMDGKITPHSFRHYFVTTVLRASGNLKLAQELARHASIQVTQRYAHLSDNELDQGYHEIFEKK